MVQDPEGISLLNTVWYEVRDLGDFCDKQYKQVEQATKKLDELRKKIVDVVQSVCQVG